ncbi:reverse transcriptase domain-containing protein [Tanacetum coccineum]
MPSHIKTYDGSEDPEDHLKFFQTAAKTKRWAMPTWCHMFNSTLTGSVRVWFDDLPPESIDSYDDLKKAFLENYLQQKKYIKYPIKLHNIKQRDGESTKDFVRRYKMGSMDVKGALECMRISGFVHGIINPELIKRWKAFVSNQRASNRIVGKGATEGAKKGEPSGADYEDLGNFIYKRKKRENWNEKKKDVEGLFLFSGEIIWPIRQIQLLVKIGDADHSTSAWMNFVVVRSPSPYNEIIERPGVRKLQAVPSTAHGMLKLSVEGVITLKSSRLVPLECALVFGSEGTLPANKPTVEERIKVAINPEYLKQTVMIGSTLTEEGRNKLCGLL